MQPVQHSEFNAYGLITLLEELSAGIDPEFDATYEDLDREFAACRLDFGNA